MKYYGEFSKKYTWQPAVRSFSLAALYKDTKDTKAMLERMRNQTTKIIRGMQGVLLDNAVVKNEYAAKVAFFY